MPFESVLLVGFGREATGFGRVTSSIASALIDRHDVMQFALDLAAAPAECRRWPIVANGVRFDPLGLEKLAETIERYRPDVVWIINDFWWLQRYADIVERFKASSKFVAYVPLDGRILRARGLACLTLFDAVVVYNAFARQDIERVCSSSSWKDARLALPALRIIPHGVDLDMFRPLGDSDKPSWHAAGSEDFLVLNGNQNNARKRIDITLRGFAKFAKGKPSGVKLVLNCNTSGASRRSPGTNVVKLADHLGIADRIVLNGSATAHADFSNGELSRLYNRCAVGINTSWGEGWGLVSCEHGATGAAQIVCRHTAGGEIWDGHAEFLETEELRLNPAAMLQARVASMEDVAASLERLYRDRSLLTDLASKAIAAIRQPRYDWSTIGRAWSSVFEDVCHS